MRKAIIVLLLATIGCIRTGTGVDVSPEGGHLYLGGMYVFENIDAQTIDGTTWHLTYTAGDWTAGVVNGVVFQDGATDVVSDAYADAGGSPNEVTVTAAAHPFAAGEIVSISGSTNYNSVHEIQSADANTFNIVSVMLVMLEVASGSRLQA